MAEQKHTPGLLLTCNGKLNALFPLDCAAHAQRIFDRSVARWPTDEWRLERVEEDGSRAAIAKAERRA